MKRCKRPWWRHDWGTWDFEWKGQGQVSHSCYQASRCGRCGLRKRRWFG